MHRCRILLTRAAKTVAAESAATAAAAAKDSSGKAILPAAAASASVAATSQPTATTSTSPDVNPIISTSISPSSNTITTSTLNSNSTTTTSTPWLKPLYHHVQPTLFPPLRPYTLSYLTHHISSSMSAAYSLFRSQESRDRFMTLTNAPPPTPTAATENDHDDDNEASFIGTKGPIINTSVLRQSDMGILKTLALYHDLCHPLFTDGCRFSSSTSGSKRMHKVDIDEFMMGCGWALEQFHRTKEELLIKPFSLENMDKSTSFYGLINDVHKTASQDPTSLEYDFIKMTTPTIFLPLQGEGIIRLLKMLQSSRRRGWEEDEDDDGIGGIGKTNPTAAASAATTTTTTLPKFENIRVMNVALLSARVREIYPPSPPSSPLSDDHGTITKNKEAQVITQLEILYELQQKEGDEHGGNNEETTTTTTTTRINTSVMVGTFEACLEGDPNHHNRTDGGEDDNATTTTNHEWKLASYRLASEYDNIYL